MECEVDPFVIGLALIPISLLTWLLIDYINDKYM